MHNFQRKRVSSVTEARKTCFAAERDSFGPKYHLCEIQNMCIYHFPLFSISAALKAISLAFVSSYFAFRAICFTSKYTPKIYKPKY